MERHSKIKRFREMCGYFSQKNMQYEQSKTSSEQKAKIVKVLVERGITQTAIAQKVNVSQQMVGKVISGNARSHKIERIITELTGYKFPANKRVIRENAAQI